MDWLLATPQIHSAFSSLGSQEGDTYIINPNALAILEEINYKLTYEDQTLRTFRRAIGFGQNVRSDLIPLLENTKDDNILESVIRILVNLTVPVECLFSVDVLYRTEVGRHTIFELNKLLYTSKEAFTDPKSTKSVVEYMKNILESDSKLSPQKCDQINNCLLLLRNLLHIPESNTNFIVPSSNIQSNGTHAVSMQNSILWNLFIQSIDKLLLYLMTCPQRSFWGVTMVQLIALMYKDQHVSTLQKLLNLWFEASLSESSDDNESNTSSPKQGSGDSSPMLTSDPTSDSSDVGSGGCKNESAEDRRQQLRDDTKATLQEVSRKGHEYQHSILCYPTGKSDNSGTANNVCATSIDSNKSNASADAAVVAAAVTVCRVLATAKMLNAVEAMNGMSDDDAASSNSIIDLEVVEEEDEQENNHNSETATSKITTPFTQPADNVTNTTNKFMPPPALPAKPSPLNIDDIRDGDSSKETTHKSCQKVPHSGQLSLSKGKCCPQKRQCPSSQSELSDCGYGTQVENLAFSTSSNEDEGPQHQKPPCNSKPRNKQRSILSLVETKELRRKKLVKRSKSSLINMKGLVPHIPTDEDISNLLKEFTVDFLLKGYGFLVHELHTQLMTNIKIPIDTSHFFWLVTYFLKFAAQLELDMEHINHILTFDVISYLTYEGVTLCEQLEMNAQQEGCDLKPYLRRMHLVVTAIREFLQAIDVYKKISHLNEEDREHLRRLQIQISSTEDLRCLFVLLLRRFNPSLHTKQYLQDLVVTNHLLLLILDNVSSVENLNIKMMDHISQFATIEVMHYYGMLLEDFNNNGEFVNDCIFTMMHHIGGDLEQIGTLFQPTILKTFSRIWETDYELCDDWSDLIEYVIHKFINTPQKSTLSLPTTSLTELTKEHNLEHTNCSWTQEEMDTLYWYYVQSKKNNDVVGKIANLFSNNGNKQKPRISIIQQLLQQDIITLVEYDDLMKFEDAKYQRALLTTPTSSTTESGIELKDSSTYGKPSDDIQILRDLIIKENKGKHLMGLQKLLLECCYIKTILNKSTFREDHQNLDYVMEPVAYHCILKNNSIPVVQWNNDQASTMLYQPYVLLLHKLGFQLPADAGSIYARIPDFWTAETMYSLAKKLGPLDKLLIKFDLSQLENYASLEREMNNCQHIMPPRASISSGSSFDVELLTIEENNAGASTSSTRGLTPVTEVDIKVEKLSGNNEIFAVPKAKHTNSIIRYTPDIHPISTPSVPNWLQVIMRSKCNPSTSMPITATTTTTTTATTNGNDNRNDADIMMQNHHHQKYATIAAMTTTTTTMATATDMNVMNSGSNNNAQQNHTQQQQPIASLLTCQPISNIVGINNKQQQQLHHATNNGNSNINTMNDLNYTTSTTSIMAAAVTATIKEQHSHHHHQHQHQQQNQHQHHQQHHHHHYDQQQEQQQQQQKHQQQKQLQHRKQLSSDDDSAMRSLDRNDSLSSGFHTRSGSINLESEYSAMVAAVYENEVENSDNVSVTSDLIHMYVSDEDECHEFSVTSFH